MQVLKDDVRNSILLSAIDEFYQFGYKDASLRRIAKEAGVTPGNIYAYFRSKESLFATALADTVEEMNAFVQHALRGEQLHTFDISALTENITKIFLQNKKQFLILMNGSKGTDYENIKEELCQLISERIGNEYIPLLTGDNQQTDSLATEAFSTAIIEGMFHIFNSYGDNTDKLKTSLGFFISMIFSEKILIDNEETHE